MYNDYKVVLGFAPTRRKMYDPNFAYQNKKKIKEKTQAILTTANVEIVELIGLMKKDC